MTDHRLQELVNEVAAEVRRGFKGFAIERVQRVEHMLRVTFSWSDPAHIEVTINLNENDTDEAVKDEIRRQLRSA